MGVSAKSGQDFERLRRWPRAAVHLAVSFSNAGVPYVGAISDLSSGGLRLVAAVESAKAGDGLDFTLIFVPGLPPHHLRGQVIWRVGEVCGVEFADNVSSEHKARHVLRRVVSYHLAESRRKISSK